MDKQAKLEELRKKLLALSEEEYNKLLDTSNDKEQRYWNARDALLTNNPMWNPEYRARRDEATARAKQSASMMGKQNGLGYKHTDEAKRKISESMKGERHGYGRGKIYIELTTGYIGTLTDMARKFNIKYPSNFNQYVGKPMQRGALKGLHFEIYTK